MGKITIAVNQATKQRLIKRMKYGDSYDKEINHLLDATEQSTVHIISKFPPPHEPIDIEIPTEQYNLLICAANGKQMQIADYLKWLYLESPDSYRIPAVSKEDMDKMLSGEIPAISRSSEVLVTDNDSAEHGNTCEPTR